MNKNTLDITKGERTKIANMVATACTLSTAFDTYKNQVNEAALAMVKAGFLPRFATTKGSKESAFALACNMALRQGIVDSIADPRLRAAVQMPKARLDELCQADKDARITYISGTLNARVLALGLEIAKALPDLTESKAMIKKAEENAKRRALAQAERRGKEKAAKIENAKATRATRAPQQPTAEDAPATPAAKGTTYPEVAYNAVVKAINTVKALGKHMTEADKILAADLKAALGKYDAAFKLAK
jgi:hypothetical protein